MPRIIGLLLAFAAAIVLAADPLVCAPDCGRPEADGHESDSTEECLLCQVTLTPAVDIAFLEIPVDVTRVFVEIEPAVPLRPGPLFDPPPRHA